MLERRSGEHRKRKHERSGDGPAWREKIGEGQWEDGPCAPSGFSSAAIRPFGPLP